MTFRSNQTSTGIHSFEAFAFWAMMGGMALLMSLSVASSLA